MGGRGLEEQMKESDQILFLFSVWHWGQQGQCRLMLSCIWFTQRSLSWVLVSALIGWSLRYDCSWSEKHTFSFHYSGPKWGQAAASHHPCHSLSFFSPQIGVNSSCSILWNPPLHFLRPKWDGVCLWHLMTLTSIPPFLLSHRPSEIQNGHLPPSPSSLPQL